jgi:hypothetical protein
MEFLIPGSGRRGDLAIRALAIANFSWICG